MNVEPAWVMVVVMIIGQGAGAIWIVATVKTECRQAKEEGKRANGRIDELLQQGGPVHGQA